MIDVTIIPLLKDNYCYLIQSAGKVGIIDPSEAKPVLRILKEKDLTPDFILNTHHHWDHTNGNVGIRKAYPKCRTIAPASEEERIDNINLPVDEETELTFGDEKITILETPGHTRGAVCFYFKKSGILFTGDTLFSMGCGRMFEGTADQMFNSLEKIKSLPPETKLYCGHEYTVQNAEFGLHVSPDNEDIKSRLKTIKPQVDNGVPSMPVTLEDELKTNVFLMAKSAEEFGALRSQKDNF